MGLNAFGLRSKVASTASRLAASFSTLLKQFTQLQPSQYIPDAKHSQYLLKNISKISVIQQTISCNNKMPSVEGKKMTEDSNFFT